MKLWWMSWTIKNEKHYTIQYHYIYEEILWFKRRQYGYVDVTKWDKRVDFEREQDIWRPQWKIQSTILSKEIVKDRSTEDAISRSKQTHTNGFLNLIPSTPSQYMYVMYASIYVCVWDFEEWERKNKRTNNF